MHPIQGTSDSLAGCVEGYSLPQVNNNISEVLSNLKLN